MGIQNRLPGKETNVSGGGIVRRLDNSVVMGNNNVVMKPRCYKKQNLAQKYQKFLTGQ